METGLMSPPDWLTGTTAILALAISTGSLIVSALAYRRAGASERVNAWIEIGRSDQPEWMIGTLHVQNRSREKIVLNKLFVQAFPDFHLANYYEALVTTDSGERTLPKRFDGLELYIGMPISPPVSILPSESKAYQFLLHHASYSRLAKVKVGLIFESLTPKPSFRTITMVARTRSQF